MTREQIAVWLFYRIVRDERGRDFKWEDQTEADKKAWLAEATEIFPEDYSMVKKPELLELGVPSRP